MPIKDCSILIFSRLYNFCIRTLASQLARSLLLVPPSRLPHGSSCRKLRIGNRIPNGEDTYRKPYSKVGRYVSESVGRTRKLRVGSRSFKAEAQYRKPYSKGSKIRIGIRIPRPEPEYRKPYSPQGKSSVLETVFRI